MSNDTAAWSRKPKENSSIWLSLTSKDDTARVRIAAAPLRQPTIWPASGKGKPMDAETVANLTQGQWMSVMRSPDWEIRETYILLVIDRADSQAKVFKVSGSVYGKIRDYAMNEEWGNPMGYDITVRRTEDPGKAYWEVTPSPKSPLLNSDVDKVAKLDTKKLVPFAIPASETQPDDIAENTVPEELPYMYQTAGTAAGAQEDDVVITDIDDKPVNLDDIPF